MTGRSIPEWIGKTPDTKVPPRVRQRVYDRFDGRCYLSGIAIAGKPWDLEHIKPLHLGGEHRERNLAPVLKDAHAEKTAAEMAAKGHADRAGRRHSGARVAPKRPIKSAGFPASGRRDHHPMPSLPPKSLFIERER